MTKPSGLSTTRRGALKAGLAAGGAVALGAATARAEGDPIIT